MRWALIVHQAGWQVEFRILGPMEIRRDEESVAINSPRQRMVLATMLLDPDRVVPVARLMRAVWRDAPPATARTQIQCCVSALRRRLGPDVILTRPGGYLLSSAKSRIDSLVFAEKVRRAGVAIKAGDLASAAVDLRAGLAQWRGPALADLVPADEVGPAASLEERRLATFEELADIELSLGNHAAVVADLVDVALRQPIRERLPAQLMLALYRCGRPTEALDVYRRARRILVEDQGIEPGLELRRLERRILTADPSLATVAASGPATAAPHRPTPPSGHDAGARFLQQLPAASADFTGRESVVARIESLLTTPSAGLRLVVLSGQAGVGKSSLAVHVASRVRQAFPDGQLFVALHGMRPHPLEPGAALSRLLRSVGLPDTAHAESLDERAAQFRDAVAGRRLLLLFDDARAAAQVRPLLPGATCGVIVTSRARLTSLAGALNLHLATFTFAESSQLLEHIVGAKRVRADRAGVQRLAELCGNLPLAVRIAGARLAARPEWTPSQLARRLRDEQSRLDELTTDDLEVRASLSLGYQALSDQARRLLRRIGLLYAPDITAEVATAAVADCPTETVSPIEVERTLETLVDASLLEVSGGATGRMRYRMHDLVRLFARERALAEEDEAACQEPVRRMLETCFSLAQQAEPLLPTRTLARLSAGTSRPRPGPAPSWMANDPVTWFEEERATLRAAVAQAAELGRADLAWELAASCQAFHELRGYYDDARELHLAALGACRAKADRLGEAVMLRNLADLWISRPGADLRDKLTSAEAALRLFRELGEPRGLVDTLWLCADVHRVMGRHDRALAELEEAASAAASCGYELGEARVLAQLAIIHREQGRPQNSLDLACRALELGVRLGFSREQSVALTAIGLAHRGLGQFDVSERFLRRALGVAQNSGDRAQETYGLVRLGQLYSALGRSEAQELLLEGLSRSVADGHVFGEALALFGMGELDLARGEGEQAVSRLERAAKLLADMRFTFVRAQVLSTLARAYLMVRDTGSAERTASTAHGLFAQIGNLPACAELAETYGSLSATGSSSVR